jgi:hypothetical protein
MAVASLNDLPFAKVTDRNHVAEARLQGLRWPAAIWDFFVPPKQVRIRAHLSALSLLACAAANCSGFT